MGKRIAVSIITPILICVFIVSIVFNIAVLVNMGGTKALSNITKEEFFELLEKETGSRDVPIPIIEINTEDEKFPEDKENYVNCSFKLSNTEKGAYDFEKTMASSADADGGVGIRLRGNSTFIHPKKPFRVKFNEKTSLLGLEKNKSWVLLADYADGSKVRNYAGFKLASKFSNLEFTPTPNHVVLFVNNNFLGLYLLTEQIDENNGRVDVKRDFDVTTENNFPFLVEIDFHITDKFFEIDSSAGMYAEIKYPEEGDVDNITDYDSVKTYIQQYMSAVWKSLKTGDKVSVEFCDAPMGFEDLVNIDSFIDYYLVNEILENRDCGIGSTYVHKDLDGRLEFGPVWDFDLLYSGYGGEANELLNTITDKPLFLELLKHEKYYEMVCLRFDEIKANILSLAEDLKTYKSIIGIIAEIDSYRWYGNNLYFLYNYQRMVYRLTDRYLFLDKVFNLSHEEFLQTYLN